MISFGLYHFRGLTDLHVQTVLGSLDVLREWSEPSPLFTFSSSKDKRRSVCALKMGKVQTLEGRGEDTNKNELEDASMAG